MAGRIRRNPVAKIFYSMAGEGRGHAARVAALTEHLRKRHQLVLLAPDEAYDFLAPKYAGSEFAGQVRVERIPGMRFKYTSGRLDVGKTIACGLQYRFALGKIVRQISKLIDEEQPQLAISDFEPALPRAARRSGIPLLSLDHQHFMVTYDLSSLSLNLQFQAWLMGLAVKAHCRDQVETVVSAFYFPPLRSDAQRVTQVGPLLRREIASAQPHNGGYILSYLRHRTPPAVLEMLGRLGLPVKIYGLGGQPPRGALTFHEIDSQQFVSDLAGCEGYIGAAGNQALGEAVFLGKPVLALPEIHHHEQRINAHFIRHMQVGDWAALERVRWEQISAFVPKLDEYRQALASYAGKIDGTSAALEAIERNLPLKNVTRQELQDAARTKKNPLYDALSPASP
jgi:uncharacterized protein (TIGR00661 family)